MKPKKIPLTTAERVAQYYNHCEDCGDFLKNSLLVYGLCEKCAKESNNIEITEVKPNIIKL
jgi:hypothetical protein